MVGVGTNTDLFPEFLVLKLLLLSASSINWGGTAWFASFITLIKSRAFEALFGVKNVYAVP